MSAIHNLMGVVAGAAAGGVPGGSGSKLGLIQSGFDAARGVASHLNNPTAGGVYTPAQVAYAMGQNAPAYVAPAPATPDPSAAAAPAAAPAAATAAPQTVKSGKPKDDAAKVEDHRIEAAVFAVALLAAAGGGFYFYKRSKKAAKKA